MRAPHLSLSSSLLKYVGFYAYLFLFLQFIVFLSNVQLFVCLLFDLDSDLIRFAFSTNGFRCFDSS